MYYRQMVAQICVNKEMCLFYKCFHYFVHPLYVGSHIILVYDYNML